MYGVYGIIPKNVPNFNNAFTGIPEETQDQCLSLPVVPEEKNPISFEAEPSTNNEVKYCGRSSIIFFLFVINMLLEVSSYSVISCNDLPDLVLFSC